MEEAATGEGGHTKNEFPSLVEICMQQVKKNVTTLDLTGCNEDVISVSHNT